MSDADYEGERCDACGCVGEDRRTLKMSCFYDMSEMRTPHGLPLPFDEQVVLHAPVGALSPASPPATIRTRDGGSIALSAGTVTTDAELRPERLFTLRVCKLCRGRWMEAIARWYGDTRDVAYDVRRR